MTSSAAIGDRMRLPIAMVPLLTGVMAVVTGGAVLVTWALGPGGIGLARTKPNTAIALVALGAAVVLLRDAGRARARIGGGLAALVGVYGVVVLFEYLVAPVGIDDLLVGDAAATSGRSAPHTALSCVLLGAALATLDRDVRGHRPSDWATGGAVAVVLSALVGYAYQVDLLRATPGATSIAITTTVALAALTVGAACLRPERGVVAYLRRDDPGATTARRLLPAIVALPLVLGFLRLEGESLGLDPALGVGLTALATIGVLLALVGAVCLRLSASDGERVRAEAATTEALTRFRALLEATPEPMVVVDSKGRIAHVNRLGEECFGYDSRGLVGEPVECLLPERFRRMHRADRAAFAAQPRARPMGSGRELYARRKDGSELPVEISLSPVETAAGPLVIAAIRDITERKRAEEGLREAAHFFDMSHDLLCTASADGRFQTFNGAWESTLGWTADELRRRPIVDFLHPDDVAATQRETARLGPGVPTKAFVNRYRTKDGGWRWLEWNATAAVGEGLIYASARDITSRVLADEARRAAEAQFTRAFEEAPIGMALVALDGDFVSVNPALCELTGYSAAELRATTLDAISDADDVEPEADARRRLISGELGRHLVEQCLVGAGGEVIPVEVGITLVRTAAGEPSHFVTQVVDMSERKRHERQLQHLADHDPLTGLFNRRRFEAELARELSLAARYGSAGAVLALDLDHFKYVNDSLGHSIGDELITRIGIAVRSRLRETDVLARLGGDEFAIVLPRVGQREALLVAESLLAAIRKEGQLEGVAGRVTASVGVAMFGDPPNVTAEQLMVEADIAMYDAKEAGRDRAASFSAGAGRQERMQARLSWADRIRTALAHDGFVLHAQPIVGLHGDDAARYELLVRMLGEDGTLIMPDTFLYIAERFNLIQEIDRWVFGTALKLLVEQQRAGRDVRFSLNLSAKSVTDATLSGFIAEQVRASGADPRRLCFEITETAAIVNFDAAMLFAKRMRELGCSFALDDFGAGFASFYYLKHLEFDFLKIDGEFIQGLADSRVNQLVVASLVQIARGLGKRTVAEFVSDEQTLALLQRYGVDYAQGFHIARPGPIGSHGGGPAALSRLERLG